MTGDYQSLTNFIRKVIVNPKLPFNRLNTTSSAINSIIYEFEKLGWVSEDVTGEHARHLRHKLHSPDREIHLQMNSAKVYRHPLHTEQICQRKHLTRRMLEYDNLPVPPGVDFSAKERNVARAYFEKVSKPVVIKPTNSGGSNGVTVGVYDVAGFEAAWRFALDDGRTDSNVLIEEFVRGVELRALVVGDEVVSVVGRVQPFVVGNGHADLEELIQDSNETRTVHYRAMQLPVVIDWDFISRQGHSSESVPVAQEIVYLNPLGLPNYGALLVDVTDTTSDAVKDLSVKAKNAIPDLEIAGVDIMITNLDDVKTASILEVNTAPSLNLHRYTTHGKSRDVELDIVNYFHSQYLAGSECA